MLGSVLQKKCYQKTPHKYVTNHLQYYLKNISQNALLFLSNEWYNHQKHVRFLVRRIKQATKGKKVGIYPKFINGYIILKVFHVVLELN